ncbi:MAG: winged helix-turn-helix domain-containing protein [Bacilli bacterium]
MLELDVLFREVLYPTRAEFAQWREMSRIQSMDLVLITHDPLPSLKARALRTGAYDVISETGSARISDDVGRILESVRRERRMFYKHEIAIRSYGEAVVTIRGKKVVLTRTEANLLKALIESKGRYLSTERLIAATWGNCVAGHKEDLYVYISRLRDKLEEMPGKPQLIVSSRGLGYAFLGEVTIERQF